MTVTGKRLTGRHVFIGVATFFALVTLVNVVMISFAVGTFDGLQTDNAYNEGRSFNQTIAAARARAGLGWQDSLMLEPGRVTLALADRDGQPVSGLVLSGQLRGLTHADADQALAFRETTTGRYEAVLARPVTGRWEVRVSTRAPDGTPVDFRQQARVGG